MPVDRERAQQTFCLQVVDAAGDTRHIAPLLSTLSTETQAFAAILRALQEQTPKELKHMTDQQQQRRRDTIRTRLMTIGECSCNACIAHYDARPHALECFAPVAASAGIANTAENRDRIAWAGIDLGCSCSSEYPDRVRQVALNKRVAHIGTANGHWQADIFDSVHAELEGCASRSTVTIPASHAGSAEGIARYTLGVLAGIIEYTAYATEREMRAAKRAERSARNDGR